MIFNTRILPSWVCLAGHHILYWFYFRIASPVIVKGRKLIVTTMYEDTMTLKQETTRKPRLVKQAYMYIFCSLFFLDLPLNSLVTDTLFQRSIQDKATSLHKFEDVHLDFWNKFCVFLYSWFTFFDDSFNMSFKSHVIFLF